MSSQPPSDLPPGLTAADLLSVIGDQMSFNLSLIKALVLLRDGPRDRQEASFNELADRLSEMLNKHVKLVGKAYGATDVD